jgi:hypothetical protein
MTPHDPIWLSCGVKLKVRQFPEVITYHHGRDSVFEFQVNCLES